MTQEQMRQRVYALIAEIQTLKTSVELPVMPEDHEITWEMLGNLALILGGLRALYPHREAATHG